MKSLLKRLLVPVDPSPYSRAATEAACFLAQAHRASVSCVAVLDSDEIRANLIPAIGPYYPLMIEEIQHQITNAGQILRDCLARAAEICRRAEVEFYQTEYDGIPAEKLMASSIFHDLVVMGLETSFHFETHSEKGTSLHRLLDYTSTPVLAVPTTGFEKLEHVAIAFDGSQSSSRALHDFVPFATPFQPKITLFTAEKTPQQSDFLLGNGELFLRDHGFSEIHRIATPQAIEEAFPQFLSESDTDLVVLGMRSRHTLRDLFVGNFTRTMIERRDHALFLSH